LQEVVAEAFALAGTFDQAADVGELDAGVNRLLRAAHLGQAVDARVGHLGHANVGVNSGKGIGRSQRSPARKCVV